MLIIIQALISFNNYFTFSKYYKITNLTCIRPSTKTNVLAQVGYFFIFSFNFVIKNIWKVIWIKNRNFNYYLFNGIYYKRNELFNALCIHYNCIWSTDFDFFYIIFSCYKDHKHLPVWDVKGFAFSAYIETSSAACCSSLTIVM